MQDIAPFYGWEKYYSADTDQNSPFFGTEYNLVTYQNHIYDYYIHPLWDFIGSETLYVKILFADYQSGFAVIEMFGEWNDTLHNDIMHFKRNLIESLTLQKINKFILIGENVLNFHGSYEDDYYAEWFEEIEEGWIVALNFADHVLTEFVRYRLDFYINYGGTLELVNWRTHSPAMLFAAINKLIQNRLN